MARTGWSGANFLRYSGAVVTGYPFTIACWVRPPTGIFTAAADFFGIFNSAAAGDRNRFVLRSNAADAVLFAAADSVGSTNATATGTFAGDTWGHICGVGTSATNRACFFNGGGKGTTTTSRIPASLDRTSIGLEDNTGAGFAPPSGTLIAEAAIWNIALADVDAAMLGAQRASPLKVRPDALVGYWPLIGNYGPEIEVIKRQEMAVQGTLSAAIHPAIFYSPRRRRPAFTVAGAPPAANPPRLAMMGVGA